MPAAVAIASFTATFALFIFMLRRAGLQMGDISGWMQAVGSVVAIYASVRIATDQTVKQRHLERLRAARENHRVATFVGEVISDAVHIVQAIEESQRRWQQATPYLFNDRPRLQAAQLMIQAATGEKPFVELIRPIIDMHAILISVELAATQLEGQGRFLSNSRFDLLWNETNRQLDSVRTSLSNALGIAGAELRAAEDGIGHH